MPPGRKAKR